MPARSSLWLLAALGLLACEGSRAPVTDPPPPPPPPPGAYVVVAADALADVGAEFAAYRASTGYVAETHTVTALGGAADVATFAANVRAALVAARAAAPAESAGLHLLLLGAAPVGIPALACTSTLGACETDNLYADVDGDGLPEAAVGRLPARTAAQARDYLAKLQAHEGPREPGLWHRRLGVYTGQANFGPEVDAAIELAVMEGLKHVSHAFDVLGAYDNPNSAYYYDPFESKVLDLYDQGSLALVYVGHGSADWTEGITTEQLGQVHCAHLRPFAVFLACGNGAYTGPADSIAATVLWKPDGPIASFGASEESHPYGNGLYAYEMMRVLLDERPPTLGLAAQGARRALVEHDDEFRQFLDTLARAEVTAAEQELIRHDHVNLYNYFGDPAAVAQLPSGAVNFAPVRPDLKARRATVTGRVPGMRQGTVLVTYEVERNVLLYDLAPVDPSAPDPATIQENWRRAVDKVIAGATVPVTDGAFRADLTWTAVVPGGTTYLKAYAWNDTTDAAGFLAIE
ncbi:MAG TPA: C25 family cysteine peptidase [Polyangia bacterium]|jgi:hypothetical protein